MCFNYKFCVLLATVPNQPSVTVLVVYMIIMAVHILHSHAVPMVSIVTSGSAPLYAGTSFSLTCNFTLSPSVDTSPATAVSWRVSGTAVDTSSDRITASGDSLSFSPLATSDSGSYTCEVTVTTQEHTTVEGSGQSAAVEVTVESNK